MLLTYVIIGMFLGGLLGVFGMCLCIMAGRRDAAVRAYTERPRTGGSIVKVA